MAVATLRHGCAPQTGMDTSDIPHTVVCANVVCACVPEMAVIRLGRDASYRSEFTRVLAEREVHTTFFMLGSMVAGAPGLAAEIAAPGRAATCMPSRPCGVPFLLDECDRRGLAVGPVGEHGWR
jgi:hypothetical protein